MFLIYIDMIHVKSLHSHGIPSSGMEKSYLHGCKVSTLEEGDTPSFQVEVKLRMLWESLEQLLRRDP
jgi:hypothetical protein